MIVESIILGVTTITCASLWMADRVMTRVEGPLEKDDSDARARTFAEKRRILERDRREWIEGLADKDRKTRQYATDQITRIDKRLWELADEEMNE
jgi:hypothetical protein